MNKDRVIVAAVLGVISFSVANSLVESTWLRATLTPDPLVRPWFTNSSGAVLFTSAVIAFAAFAIAAGAGNRGNAIGRGVAVSVGAMAAMLAAMVRMGAGTLGPIAFVIGAAVLLAAGMAGGSAAAVLKKN